MQIIECIEKMEATAKNDQEIRDMSDCPKLKNRRQR